MSKLALALFLVRMAHGAALNACDLNGDGVVNAADVQAAINMTLGIAPCTAAVAGTNVCNVVVVQRVVNAWILGACLTSTGLHVVVLTWTPSTSAGVTGYNVYRGNKLGSYKPLVSLGNVSSYMDTTVVSGLTYYYAIKAVRNGGESAYSSPVEAVIPIP